MSRARDDIGMSVRCGMAGFLSAMGGGGNWKTVTVNQNVSAELFNPAGTAHLNGEWQAIHVMILSRIQISMCMSPTNASFPPPSSYRYFRSTDDLRWLKWPLLGALGRKLVFTCSSFFASSSWVPSWLPASSIATLHGTIIIIIVHTIPAIVQLNRGARSTCHGSIRSPLQLYVGYVTFCQA